MGTLTHHCILTQHCKGVGGGGGGGDGGWLNCEGLWAFTFSLLSVKFCASRCFRDHCQFFKYCWAPLSIWVAGRNVLQLYQMSCRPCLSCKARDGNYPPVSGESWSNCDELVHWCPRCGILVGQSIPDLEGWEILTGSLVLCLIDLGSGSWSCGWEMNQWTLDQSYSVLLKYCFSTIPWPLGFTWPLQNSPWISRNFWIFSKFISEISGNFLNVHSKYIYFILFLIINFANFLRTNQYLLKNTTTIYKNHGCGRDTATAKTNYCRPRCKMKQ